LIGYPQILMILIKVKINRSKRDLKILYFDQPFAKNTFEENLIILFIQ
jgi:hypothetical protein